jgi:hypothetical protein
MNRCALFFFFFFLSLFLLRYGDGMLTGCQDQLHFAYKLCGFAAARSVSCVPANGGVDLE